jgi:hypothetical protein
MAIEKAGSFQLEVFLCEKKVPLQSNAKYV